jgi:hypothetical protein
MTSPTTILDKKDRDELIDFGIRLGQACWDVYCRSKAGFPRVFMLPNDTARRQANELFHLGFSARLFMCPPDTAAETSDGEALWEAYLDTMDGKVVLGSIAYPDTPEFILDYAKDFFLQGFSAGTIAVREIFKS